MYDLYLSQSTTACKIIYNQMNGLTKVYQEARHEPSVGIGGEVMWGGGLAPILLAHRHLIEPGYECFDPSGIIVPSRLAPKRSAKLRSALLRLAPLRLALLRLALLRLAPLRLAKLRSDL